MEFKRIADIKRLVFIIDTLKSRLPSNAVVLDVGCGNGIISRSLGEHGFNVYGIDISEKAIEKAKQLNKFAHVKFDVLSAEHLISEGKKYNAIICSEVLEHLSEPGDLLKVLYNSISDDGIVIVTVPNGRGAREMLVTKPVIALQKKNNSLWRVLLKTKQMFGYKGTTVQSDASNLTHLQFFTKKALEELADRHQFKIIKFGKTNFVEDVFPFSLLSKRIKFLQKIDCAIAEFLPYGCTGGFVSVWQKNNL
jgi:2-polyprenyl-3-methyl-5-hydroxy-6-metoxy-1,4-benzoquinol methylase